MRVVLGCQHALLREGIRELLKRWSGVELVGAAPSVIETARVVDREQPDVVLLVRGDSPRDTQAAIDAAREAAPACSVLLVESADRQGTRQNLGEDGRVTRSVGINGLVRALWEACGDESAAEHCRSSRVGPEPRQILTNREWDVARAVCQGVPNKTIARQLGISEKTVKNHLSSIYRRTGISGRTQLAVWAIEHGLARVNDLTA